MDEIIAKLEVCMATLDKMAAGQDGSSSADMEFRGRPYTSMVKVNGKPILPPLMTPDIRTEMTRYKALAIQREREREDRKHQNLLARVEGIVSSYEESRQSLGSKESSPQPAASTLPNQAMHSPDMQSVAAQPVPVVDPLSNPSYSPLKYMETDEEEWNVRPATPWRRTKASKTKTVIAANFDPRGHQPISSNMRIDHSQDSRGTTPDVSAISLASSQASHSLPGSSPVGAIDLTASTSAQPVLKEVLPSSPPALENLKVITIDGTAATLPVNVSGKVSPVVTSGVKSGSPEPQENKSHDHSVVKPPEPSAAHVDSAVISRLSPIPKVDAVQNSGGDLAGSSGSQSTNSSTNSALNQTVIDLSQMSLAQDQTNLEKEDSPKPGMKAQDSPKHAPLSIEAKARVEQATDDTRSKESRIFVANSQEDNHAVGYLSDTESYMSLLGEYSLLPTPGSSRGTPDTIPKKDSKKVPFFADPTSPDSFHVKHEAVTPQGAGQAVEGIKSDLPAADASIEPVESLKSADMSEYCGSSLGTLAQSVTLPISLSMTSESTLQGMEETWDRTSREVTPTGTEGALAIIGDELTSAGMVRAAPVGQESNGAGEVMKQAVIESEESVKPQSPSVEKPLPSLSSDRTSGNEIEKTGVKIERSGVKVESDFKTPLRHHARKASYTLDFPSPALLDAEARHQAPHVSGRDVSYDSAGTKGKEADAKTERGPSSEQVTVSEQKQPDELSSEMKDLKIDDVSEAKVLSLQLSCLEQMQQRLQRQHEEQMRELMLQQSQELSLLQSEMEGIRRQAAQSALGHVDDQDVIKTLTEVPSLHDESVKEDQASSKENSSEKTLSSKPPLDKDDRSEKNSSKIASNQRKNAPPSPNSRKRRFEESSEVSMIEVPYSYIKESSLAGKGYAFPGFHSPVSDKLLANTKKKLTPQDSLESDHTGDRGLVEIPPSYIKSGSYHRPVSRSPTHQRSLAVPTTTGSAHLASLTSPADEPSVHESSQLTTWGTPLKEASDRDSTKLSTWASPVVGQAEGLGHIARADAVNSLSDSFFLNDGQTGQSSNTEGIHQEPTSYFRPWTITPSLQMDSRFDKLSARVKGYLTRALMRTPKVKALIKTIKDTQVFLYQFQAETPVKRGKLSEQDTRLAHRVLAQLSAARYELDDIFHVFPIQQRLAILRHAREQERENYFNKKVSPGTGGQKLLSAATKKAMERRQQLAKEGDVVQSGPKRQKLIPENQRPKSAAETRVLRPLQSHKSPARPATAVPPRMSSFSISTQSQKVKPSVVSKPFPSKPVMVARNATKTTRSPSRTSSSRPASTRPTSTRPTSTRPTSKLSGGLSSQARISSTRQAKSPARAATSSQTKGKSVRRSLYPVTVGTGKKTMQRKQADTRKP